MLSIMLIIALLPVASLAEATTNKPPASENSPQGNFESNGDLVVYMLKDNSWQEQGSLSFDRFLRKKELRITEIPNTEEVKIKIVQNQGGNAHLDAVLLGGKMPIKVNKENIPLRKLSKQDFDVAGLAGKEIELTFPQVENSKTLEIYARIEAEVISKTPFLFPVQRGEWVINENSSFYTYKLSADSKTSAINKLLDTLSTEEPFFKQICLPGSGHPSGFMYGWVKNDSENLYVAIDATSDNTMDGDKDYTKVYVKTATGIKEFKQSVLDTKWGEPSFIYTDKVAYQHKVYEFVIPLKELNISDSNRIQDISLAFEVYGTLADPINFEYNNYTWNEQDGTITFRVLRSGEDSDNVVVSYGAIIEEGITATFNEDYTIGGTGELVFGEGDTEKTFDVNIIDDTKYEPGYEVFKIFLRIKMVNDEDVVDTLPNESVVWIADNDDLPRNTVQFEQASYETIERDGVSVYVTRSGSTERAVDVMYRITDISTSKGRDYIEDVETGTFEIAAGEARYHLWIPLLNDGEEEPDETLSIKLVEADAGYTFGELRETEVKIIDDDEDNDYYRGTISFERNNYSVKEDAGVAQIKVIYDPEEYEGPYYMTLISDDEIPEGAIAVEYTTEEITAIEGSDYTKAYGILIFADTYEQIFTIAIENDSIAEEDETVKLRLVDGRGAGPGEITIATLTIIDDDEYVAEPEAGTINFTESTYSIKEDKGKAIITVVYTPQDNEEQISLASEDVVTVKFAASDGTAKESVDYEKTVDTLTFNREELIKTVEVQIKNDSKVEGNETVNLTLFDVTGSAELGEQDHAVLTIVNDDKKVVKKSSPPKEVPPNTENLPDGTIIGRMKGYITLSQPIKIMDDSKELQLSYNIELSKSNTDNTPRVYYWNAEKKNWVALATYTNGEGKVKAINDNAYKGWFVVFGVIQPEFSDLEGSDAEQLLNRMNGLGIIEGIPIMGETKVRLARPQQTITRAEFAMLISRLLNIDVDDHKLPLMNKSEANIFNYANFTDSNQIADWVWTPVGTLIRAKLIAGEGKEFRGEEPITRIEGAVMISKALKLLTECQPADLTKIADADEIPDWAKQELAEGVIEGYEDGAIRPNDNITRADAFDMLYKLFVTGLGW
jgi:hypothetical protein